MSEFSKLGSSHQSRRLSSNVNILAAHRREFEYRDKLKHLERKMSLDLMHKSRTHTNQLKWQARADLNLTVKQIFATSANANALRISKSGEFAGYRTASNFDLFQKHHREQQQQKLTPSVDEWIRMRKQQQQQKFTPGTSYRCSKSKLV